jgi:hypothetical protein
VPRRVDLLSVTACALALAVVVLYLVVMSEQDEDPVVWAVTILLGAVAGTAYAARRSAPVRRFVLVLCALGLFALGLLAIFSVGLPILLAAALCLAAAVRGRSAKDWRDTV